jgi:hypothetical protein
MQVADGFDGGKPEPLEWLLTAPLPKADRQTECIRGAGRKVKAVFAELGIEHGSTESAVLVGDFVEGIGRGMIGSARVAPFYHQLAAMLRGLHGGGACPAGGQGCAAEQAGVADGGTWHGLW